LDEFASCIGCMDFGLACTAGDFTFAFNFPGDGAAHVGNDGTVEGSTFINGDGVGRGGSRSILWPPICIGVASGSWVGTWIGSGAG
jgi:hypothetical protein